MFNFSKKEKKEPKDLKEVLKELKSLGDNLNRVSADLEIIKKLGFLTRKSTEDWDLMDVQWYGQI